MAFFDQAKMMLRARRVQQELKNTEIEAKSSDGAVAIVLSGELRIKRIEIAPLSLRPENKRHLEGQIQQTFAEAMARAQTIAAEKTREVMKDMNLNLPGL